MPECLCDLSFCPACDPIRQAHKFSGRPVSGSANPPPGSARLTTSRADAASSRGAAAGSTGTLFDDLERECHV